MKRIVDEPTKIVSLQAMKITITICLCEESTNNRWYNHDKFFNHSIKGIVGQS